MKGLWKMEHAQVKSSKYVNAFLFPNIIAAKTTCLLIFVIHISLILTSSWYNFILGRGTGYLM